MYGTPQTLASWTFGTLSILEIFNFFSAH